MIRGCIFGDRLYCTDIAGWEDRHSSLYDNLLVEDLIERVSQGDIVIYFDDKYSAKDWAEDNKFDYEFVELDDNN